MLPPLTLLAAIVLAIMAGEPAWGPADSATGAVTAALLGLAATAVGSLALAALARRALRRSDAPFGSAVRLWMGARLGSVALTLGAFALATGPGRYGAWVAGGAGAAWPETVRLAVTLLPYGAGAAVRRLAFGGLEGGAPRAARHDARGALVVLLPLFTLVATLDVVEAIPGLAATLEHLPTLQWALLGAPGFALLLGAPWLLRLAWPTRPLPPGPLRDRLEALGRRLAFRCRDWRLWETPSPRMLNAAVAGLVPRVRTIFLTVPLVRHLPAAELDAVVAHEIAHARRRHLLAYLGLAGAFLAWLLWTSDTVALAVGDQSVAHVAALLACTGLFWGGAFGFVSRRFERQADLDGAAAVADPELMVQALARVAGVAGQPLETRAFLHGSIASRIAVLRAAATDPAVARRTHRAARRAAWAGPVLLVAGGVALWPAVRAEWAAYRGWQAAGRGDGATVEACFTRALSWRPTDPALHLARGEALARLGRPADARVAYGDALQRARDSRTRRRIAERLEALGGGP